MTGRYSEPYLDLAAPEINLATKRAFPGEKVFVDTRRICLEIKKNPHDYPILGERTQMVIKMTITWYFDQVLKLKVRSRNRKTKTFEWKEQ